MKTQFNERVFFIDREAKRPLYIQLYDAIVKAIEENEIKGHEKMPSIRQLAKSMSISRTTIENTYSQLVAEGYIYSKPQKGYFAAYLSIKQTPKTIPMVFDKSESVITKIKDEYDFLSEYVELNNFDISMWKRNINQVLLQQEVELFSGADPFGERELRTSICNYFGRVRGIKASPEQVVIDAGTQNLLNSLSHFFYQEGIRDFLIENPGFELARESFKRSGFRIKGIALKDRVIDVECIDINKQSIVFVSPSFQFPYGEIMQVTHRQQLLEKVKKTGSYIIEDDYNNELRYVGKPINSLQGMDGLDRVIYLGSFSTLLIPSIRISFMVLPKQLIPLYKKTIGMKIQGASKLEQLALSNMLNSQDFSKHIRKLRKNYRIKNELINDLFNEHIKELALFESTGAGVSGILTLKKPVKKTALRKALNSKQLRIGLLSDYLIEKETVELETKLVLNYRGISKQNLILGIQKLEEVLCQVY